MTHKRKYMIYICFILFAYCLFLLGFFPLKITFPGAAKHENFTFGPEGRVLGYPDKTHSKLVLILIDALRSDFVFERKSMQFLQSLIDRGKSHNFIVRAHPPTVTLPRIKAITTGSIPGFVDVVLNVDSQALTEDNIVSQAQGLGRKIVFYGDDTWMKLFPGHFTRSDGTTSFFVTDYTEVDNNVTWHLDAELSTQDWDVLILHYLGLDHIGHTTEPSSPLVHPKLSLNIQRKVDNNVTRHLDAELSSLDWDVLILHYLGLDHIGHTTGPNSPLVDPKLREMDGIIQRVYTALEEKSPDSVILVCGDHGMSDQGSHGGASEREVLVPAVFLSPSFNSQQHGTTPGWKSHRQPLQTDLAPTLSVMLGLPIPNNNLGQVLVGALEGLPGEGRLDAMYLNSRQMLRLLEANTHDYTTEPSYELFQRAVKLHEVFLGVHSGQEKPSLSEVLHGYEMAMEAMATKISASLTKYDLYSMTVGILLLLMMLFGEILVVIHNDTKKNSTMFASPSFFFAISLVSVFGHVTACTSQSFHSTRLCGTNPVAAVTQVIVFLCLQFLAGVLLSSWTPSSSKKSSSRQPNLSALLVAGTFGHSISLLSSSYVEEEHQTWYFLTMTFDLVVMATVAKQHIINLVQSRQKNSKSNSRVKGTEQQDIYKNESTEQEALYNEQLLERNLGRTERKSSPWQPEQNLSEVMNNGFGDSMSSNADLSLSSKSKPLIDVAWQKLLPWQPVVAMCGVMLLGRCLRSINQTGNKWLDLPDIGDWLVRPENKAVLSMLVLVSLVVVMCLLASGITMETVLCVAGLYGCYGYRVATNSIYGVLRWWKEEDEPELSKGITEARIVYFTVLAINFISFLRYLQFKYRQTNIPSYDQKQNLKIKIMTNLQSSFVILMALLLRPHNTVLVAMVILQERLLWKHLKPVISRLPFSCVALFCWWMGQAVFFQQGNSNSLSTVDIAAAYVGLTDYTPALVLLLLYLSTYAGPIFWLMTLVKYILSAGEKGKKNKHEILQPAGISSVRALTLERLFSLSVYCIVVSTQRYHLFVWTVFSPKLLYEAWLTFTYAGLSLAVLAVTW